MKFDTLDPVSLDLLASLSSWQDKYRLLIQWGKLITRKEALRCEQNRVDGCELPVWLACEIDEKEGYQFAFDSDSQIINGLAAVLISLVNHKTRKQILSLPLETLLSDAGLQKHLTPSRANGYLSIVKQLMRLLNADAAYS